jgi:phosphonate transport system substrate-binding protein
LRSVIQIQLGGDVKKLFALLIILTVLAVTAACAPAAQPTAAPPTAAPAQPTAAPAQPTAAPAQPTAAPPTAAPAEPTAAPAQPTEVPPTPTPLPEAACEKLPNAPTVNAGDVGSPENPIVIVFVPSVDVGKITIGGQAMADCLSQMTGLSYTIEVGTSEAAAIEAMGGGKAHMGFLNTFSVLVAKAKYDVEAALIAQRAYGVRQPDGSYTSFDFDPDKDLAGQLTSFYKPEYFAGVDTGITKLEDVRGHTFCFTTAGSTSGGLIPRASLKAIGIDPDTDLQSTFAGGHDKAAIAVYQGDCDAGSAFMDILTDSVTNLEAQFPDLHDKVKVFAVGDRIPNDGLQFIKDLNPEIKAITVEALLAMMKDPGGNAVVKSIYNYDNFEVADYSVYYQPFDELLQKAGVNVQELIRQ